MCIGIMKVILSMKTVHRCDNEARQAMTRMLKELPSDVANMTTRVRLCKCLIRHYERSKLQMQTKMRSYCQLAKNVRELVEKWQVEMASIELDVDKNETQASEITLRCAVAL